VSGTALQWGREGEDVDDWTGRRCRDRGTSIMAYPILLGTNGTGAWRMDERCWGRGPESTTNTIMDILFRKSSTKEPTASRNDVCGRWRLGSL